MLTSNGYSSCELRSIPLVYDKSTNVYVPLPLDRFQRLCQSQLFQNPLESIWVQPPAVLGHGREGIKRHRAVGAGAHLEKLRKV
jgi:hypothetical protein